MSQKHDQAGSMKVDITPDNNSGNSQEDVIDDLVDDIIIPEIPLQGTHLSPLYASVAIAFSTSLMVF